MKTGDAIKLAGKNYTVAAVDADVFAKYGTVRVTVRDAAGRTRQALFTAAGVFDCWEGGSTGRPSGRKLSRVNWRS